MFWNICDLNYYYLVRDPSPRLEKLDIKQAILCHDMVIPDLLRHVNTYAKINKSTFDEHCGSLLPWNGDGIYFIGASKLLVIDDAPKKSTYVAQTKCINDADAIEVLVKEMITSKHVYDVDTLYDMYTQIAITPSNKKTFSLTLGRRINLDITYRNKNIPDSIPIGALLKSIIKTNTNICYYIYDGIIPAGTRDPWLKK